MENESPLCEQLGIFYGEMDERLKNLSLPGEKQQYLEGLVHSFDSITRYAHPEVLGPFDRECFINFAKQMAYSKASDLGLDVDAKMKSLVEYHEGMGDGYDFTAILQARIGAPLTKTKMEIPLTEEHKEVLYGILYIYGARDYEKDKLATQLNIFSKEMEERLDCLPKNEQQQYLEGVVHALDSVVRNAGVGLLNPFDREYFIGSAKSWAYSKTYHLKLDPERRMRKLMESNSRGIFISHKFAAIVQTAMGIPLTAEQELALMNADGVFMIEQMGLGD